MSYGDVPVPAWKSKTWSVVRSADRPRGQDRSAAGDELAKLVRDLNQASKSIRAVEAVPTPHAVANLIASLYDVVSRVPQLLDGLAARERMAIDDPSLAGAHTPAASVELAAAHLQSAVAPTKEAAERLAEASNLAGRLLHHYPH